MAQVLYDGYTGNVTDNGGNVISGATIEVYNAIDPDPLAGANTLATIYSDRDGATSVDQGVSPIMSDANGKFTFYSDAGYYHIVVTNGGDQSAIPDVPVGTAKSLDVDEVAGSGGGLSVLGSITGDVTISDTQILGPGSVTKEQTFNVASAIRGAAFCFTNSGQHAYLFDLNTTDVIHYTLSTPYDITTMTEANDTINADAITGSTGVTEMYAAEDGANIYFLNPTTYRAYQVGLSSTNDLSTAILVGDTFVVGGAPIHLWISRDGKYMHVLDDFGDVAITSLGTPFEILTQEYSGFYSLSGVLGAGDIDGLTSYAFSEDYGMAVAASSYSSEVDTVLNFISVPLAGEGGGVAPTYIGSFIIGNDSVFPFGMYIEGTDIFLCANVDDEVARFSAVDQVSQVEATNLGIMTYKGAEIDLLSEGVRSVGSVFSDNSIMVRPSLTQSSQQGDITLVVDNGDIITRYNGFNVWRKP